MVTGSAIATLVLFVTSMFFVIFPMQIPLRRIGLSDTRIHINLSTAPILTIAILWVSKCIGATVIRDGIVGTDGVKPYNILILFFCLAYMAITLDATGILRAAAFWVSNKGSSNGRKLFFYFYVMLTAISLIVGNDPVILSATVFLAYFTEAVHLEPLAWLIAEFAAANTASMVLFVGNPTNVVICEGFHINNVAFSAYTVFPFIVCSISCFAALSYQFRSSKYVPKTLGFTGKLDPRTVLRDPVSAWVGGVLLLSCLAVILVVSFFGIDVWKITLPFAVAKFIFDISWDHWQYRSRQIDIEATEADEEDDPMRAQIQKATTTTSVASPVPALGKDELSQGPSPATTTDSGSLGLSSLLSKLHDSKAGLKKYKSHFPTFCKSLPRLPFALVPFAFSQFILIEGLAHQGWIDIFATWLVRASHRKTHPTIWIIGIIGVILCNVAGTNIGATILLTKVMRAAALPDHTARSGAIALAVASNIGAVSFTFSASLAGLLWKSILNDKGVMVINQRTFAFWNLLPIVAMTAVGLAVVSIEMAVVH
jgi:Na+/H+ antiporter NhaD/arsenite permease-like protein